MNLEHRVNKTRVSQWIATGAAYLLLLASIGCTSSTNGATSSATNDACNRPKHQKCYGIHIKEYQDHTGIEFYKEGWLQFEQEADGTKTVIITPDSVIYSSENERRGYALDFYK